MVGMGLLGAIGGFGKALETTGTTLMQRREKALEDARRLAQYERERADKLTDKATERSFELTTLGVKEDRQDLRTQAQIDAANARQESQLKFQREDKAEERRFRSTEAVKEREGRKELAKLQDQLATGKTAAEVRLRDQLSADDVHAVQYGEPNAQGYAEVLVITKDGRVRPTGRRVYRPKKEEEEGDTL